MKVSASIKSKMNFHEVIVQTNDASRPIAIEPKVSGFGSSVNGGELLVLSIATCFCNDIYREAAKRNIAIESVDVTATGEFGEEGEPGSNFLYKTAIISDADPSAIQELISYVNEIAEVHNTLRKGISVQLI